jgi:hypothetical protein
MSKAAELANLIGNINAGSPLANRNLVQNGEMLVNQRGSSAITLSGLTPHIDRFTAYKANDGTQTVEQSTDGPEGFKNSLKVTNTGADSSVAAANRVAILHRIEGRHVAHLELGTANAKTITLSFYVKSSITGTHGGSFGNAANNRAYPFTYTISSADTWERKSITVAGDTTGTWATDNTTGLQVAWGLGVGTANSGSAGAWESADRNSATGATTGFLTTANATWYLTGVQLEIGQNSTAFEHEPFDVTLRKCQRFYAHTYGYGNAIASFNQSYNGMIYLIGTGNHGCSVEWKFPVEMRATPTVDLYGHAGTKNRVTYWNGSELSYSALNRNTSQLTGFDLGAGSSADDYYSAGCVAKAEL